MKLVAIYNRQPTIRSSSLLRSAKSDRFLAWSFHAWARLLDRGVQLLFELRHPPE